MLPFFNDFSINFGSHILRSPTFYPLFIGMLLRICEPHFERVRIQGTLHLFLCLVVLWSLLSLVFNLFDIVELFHKEKQILGIVLKSFISLLFCYMVFRYTYSTLFRIGDWDLIARGIEKAVFLSFIVMLPYILLEILAYNFHIHFFGSILNTLEPLIHDRLYLPIEFHRIRSFCFEPSYTGLVLAIVFPYSISYLHKRINRSVFVKFLLLPLLFTIILFSFSRAIYLAFIAELMVFIFIVLRFGKRRILLIPLLALGLIFLVFFLPPKVTGTYASLFSLKSNQISNLARYGSIIAAMRLGLYYPMFGVGPGLSGYYLHKFYPDFFFKSYMAKFWADRIESPTFALIPNFIANIGFVGGGFFILLWVVSIVGVYRTISRYYQKKLRLDYDGMFLLMALVGLLIGSFAVDIFTFYGYWIFFGVATYYLYNRNSSLASA